VVGDAADEMRAVLQVLADLGPSAEQREAGLAIPLEWFRWLPADASRMVQPPVADLSGTASKLRVTAVDRRFGERLAAVDQVRAGERSLRIGWLFVAGRTELPDGRRRRVFHPLVTVPVRVTRTFVGANLLAVGDAEVSDLVADPALRDRFEQHVEYGGGGLEGAREPAIPEPLLRKLTRLQAFARELAAAAGLPATRVVSATGGPQSYLRADELVIVAGAAVYAVHEMSRTRAGTLRGWSAADLGRWTALHSLYLGPPAATPERTARIPSGDSPLLLTPAQTSAVERSRRDPVTLVSGAPGTGKSHTIAAIACDALRRRERVLVTAKTDATIDALLDLFERAPGLQPVVFGSSERREALAERLSAGSLVRADDDHVIAVRERLMDEMDARARLRSRLVDRLRAAAFVAGSDEEVAAARLVAPRLFLSSTSLDEAAALVERTGAGTVDRPGWWRRRRRGKARRALVRLAGADADTSVGELARDLELARAERMAADLAAAGGLEIGADWERLQAVDDEVRRLSADWLACDSRSAVRLGGRNLAAVAALATALRSGRSARREQLLALDERSLTEALPLWVGTLPDIDDLLPAEPGLFDLVILDEASSIDQPLAAPALLRATRAVVVGDPRQLRHVSFVSDERLRAALATHAIDPSSPAAARLDVRRNSVFDVAAGVAPVTTLSEHFRSDPHLVEFVARRLYGGALQVATRTPTTEDVDCVTVVRLDGKRNAKGGGRGRGRARRRRAAPAAAGRRAQRGGHHAVPGPGRRAGGGGAGRVHRRRPRGARPAGGHGPRLPGQRARRGDRLAGPGPRRRPQLVAVRRRPPPVRGVRDPGPPADDVRGVVRAGPRRAGGRLPGAGRLAAGPPGAGHRRPGRGLGPGHRRRPGPGRAGGRHRLPHGPARGRPGIGGREP
jgi:hypothetical protein